ncbi:MAG TPA: DUF885 domain-containing protein [Streptosporangiaceae bacterium]|nr:DUF885 domain-containing protein [Streptosporangiaceae bacterium]
MSGMSGPGGTPASDGARQEAAAQLAALSAEYFRVVHETDPLTATQLGVTGFDDLLPDPSRAGAARGAQRIAAVEQRLAAIDSGLLSDADQTTAAVMAHLAAAARSDLEHGLWEANASAGSYIAPQAMAFQSVPTAVLTDGAAVAGYLRRLRGLGAFFDAIAARYQQAAADGRLPAQVGVRQAIDQLDGHLGRDVADDRLVAVAFPEALPDTERAAARAEAARIVADEIRPAMRRLLDCLRDELLPVARPDLQVGIRFVPGGPEGYAAAVRRHTTTGLSPEEIHQIGLGCLESLQAEWAELGGRTLGTSDVPEILARLREDTSLRFTDSAQIVAAVTGALHRAEAARDDWFPAYDIPDCVIEEIDPVESGNAALAYYRPPAAGGLRPGAHCVLTSNPEQRFSYEYEALAFHESTPGHHLQGASAQTLTLPDFRRFLDAEVCGYVEGWGLYCERLADEMGLYTSDTQRLGMLSFDALRACRLVVDTGMHYYGWSRAAAIDFMWRNTATTRANIVNEVDRYIAWPGQALAYMIGRREIQRLRSRAAAELGPRFDVRAFHGVVLGDSAVPLGVLDQLVARWTASLRG